MLIINLITTAISLATVVSNIICFYQIKKILK
nr:MAG TPA: hypothetical protein [Bacteriophage sp.]